MVDPIKSNFLNLGNNAVGKVQTGSNDAFAAALKDSISKVNNLQQEADTAIQGLAKGELNNIHETMIAIEKASISFNMMVQVRNKLVQAYEEIMRTQV